jgi:hypothetical protein
LKQNAVTRTVHRLEAKVLIFCPFDHEEVVFVVLVVAACFPNVEVEDVRGYHLLEASLFVLSLHKGDQSVKNMSTVREPKG